MKHFNELIVVTETDLRYTEILDHVEILKTSDIQDAAVYLRDKLNVLTVTGNEDLFDKLVTLALDLISEARVKGIKLAI